MEKLRIVDLPRAKMKFRGRKCCPKQRKAHYFFQVGVLAELLGKCYTRPPLVACPVNTVNVDSSEKPQALWCYCQKEESGEMVACDSGSCQYEWFHYMCVGVLSELKGK